MAHDHGFSERVPPQNLEAEQSVLGSCLIDKEAWAKCQPMLKPEDFYSDRHQHVWNAMHQAARKRGVVDPITVQDELSSQPDPGDPARKATLLDVVGGLVYLTGLIHLVPTTANVESYAEIVATKARLRRIQAEARKVVDECYTADDPDLVLGNLQQSSNKLAAGSGKSGLKPIAGRIAAYAEQRYQNRNLPNDDWIPSRFPELREKCPFLRREVTLIAMPPNNGKTTLLANEAEFLGELGYVTAVFELEQADGQVFDKLIAKKARLPVKAVRMGLLNEQEWIRYKEAARHLDKLTNVHLNTETEETMTRIRWQCHKLKAEAGRLDFVGIDFLDRIQEKAEKNERYDQVVARIVGMGQAIARELNCHVYILAQIDVKVLERPNPVPGMSDLANAKTNLAAWPDNILTGLLPTRAKGDGKTKPKIWGRECSAACWKNTIVLNVAKGRFSEGGSMIPIYGDLATGFLGPLKRPWPWQKDCAEDKEAEYDESGDADHFRAMKRFKEQAAGPVDTF